MKALFHSSDFGMKPKRSKGLGKFLKKIGKKPSTAGKYRVIGYDSQGNPVLSKHSKTQHKKAGKGGRK